MSLFYLKLSKGFLVHWEKNMKISHHTLQDSTEFSPYPSYDLIVYHSLFHLPYISCSNLFPPWTDIIHSLLGTLYYLYSVPRRHLLRVAFLCYLIWSSSVADQTWYLTPEPQVGGPHFSWQISLTLMSLPRPLHSTYPLDMCHYIVETYLGSDPVRWNFVGFATAIIIIFGLYVLPAKLD